MKKVGGVLNSRRAVDRKLNYNLQWPYCPQLIALSLKGFVIALHKEMNFKLSLFFYVFLNTRDNLIIRVSDCVLNKLDTSATVSNCNLETLNPFRVSMVWGLVVKWLGT